MSKFILRIPKQLVKTQQEMKTTQKKIRILSVHFNLIKLCFQELFRTSSFCSIGRRRHHLNFFFSIEFHFNLHMNLILYHDHLSHR